MASNESEDARSSMVASDSDDVNASNDSASNNSALMNKPKRPSRRGCRDAVAQYFGPGAFKSQ